MKSTKHLGTFLIGMALAACGGGDDGNSGDVDGSVGTTTDAAVTQADAASEPDAAVAGDPHLVFSVEPSNTNSRTPMADVVVEIRDGNGNLMTDATDEVTLSFVENAGEVLLHAGGNGPYVLETIDPNTLDDMGWFEAQAGNEIRDILYDAANGLVYYNTRSGSEFFTLDPMTGEQTLIGTETVETRGLEFDSAGTILALGYDTVTLSSYDPTTAVVTDLGTFTPSVAETSGFNGLAADPVTGTLYAIGRTGGKGAGRYLATIDPVALTATEVAPLDDDYASIAFDSAGTLWAVSGDGADISETLFTLDPATGVATEVGSVALNDTFNSDGESLGVMPARLFGERTVAAVGGVATFSGLRIDATASGYSFGAEAAGFDSIVSAAFDITPVVDQSGVVVMEAVAQSVSEDVGDVVIGVSLDVAQAHDTTVTLHFVGGDITALEDTSLDEDGFLNIEIPAGETAGSATIAIVDDDIPEGPETIELEIANVSYGQIGKSQSHIVTIVDNDTI